MKTKKLVSLKKALITLTIFSTCSMMIAAVPPPAWIVAGNHAYRIISGVGTMITYGQLVQTLFVPGDKESKIAVRPSLTTYAKQIESGVENGQAWGADHVTTDQIVYSGPNGGVVYTTPENRGNYSETNLSVQYIVWDDDTQEYAHDPTQDQSTSAPSWVPNSHWELALNSSGAAKENSWFEILSGNGRWSTPGFFITYARSTKFEYPPVKVDSEVFNPAWNSSAVDGVLREQARLKKYKYTAAVHCERQKLKYVWDASGNGQWIEDGPWTSYSVVWPNVPGYKNATKTFTICDNNQRVRKEKVKGGLDIWWHDDYKEIFGEVWIVPLDSAGNFDTSNPHKVSGNQVQQIINYVSRFDALPTH